MTAALIVIPGICYGVAAFLYAKQSNWPLAIVYAGYSFSNYGLYLVDKIGRTG